jgi:hypothetical protein
VANPPFFWKMRVFPQITVFSVKKTLPTGQKNASTFPVCYILNFKIWWKTAKRKKTFGGKRQNQKKHLVEEHKYIIRHLRLK